MKSYSQQMPFAQMYCEMCSTYKILPCAVISLMTQLPSEGKIRRERWKKMYLFLMPQIKTQFKAFRLFTHFFPHSREPLDTLYVSFALLSNFKSHKHTIKAVCCLSSWCLLLFKYSLKYEKMYHIHILWTPAGHMMVKLKWATVTWTHKAIW